MGESSCDDSVNEAGGVRESGKSKTIDNDKSTERGQARKRSANDGAFSDQRRRDDDDSQERGRKKMKRSEKVEASDSDSDENRRRKRRKKHKHRKKNSKKKRSRRASSSSDSSDESDAPQKKVVNQRLLEKLAARGETLEEREERRAQRRAARITEKFGYTQDENPFNDPNLHETFTWKKKEDKKGVTVPRQVNQSHIFDEIEKVRKRRQDRELQFEEMERIRAEEARMKELENYDEWARKEEEFHLQQQRQRSAIRLVEGREKPVDVLAKNLLMFGLTDEERENRAAVKYKERYNALNELETLEAELEKPQDILKVLKLEELEELSDDITMFRRLESEGGLADRDSTVLRYWDNLHEVVQEEIQFLKDGGEKGEHASAIKDIRKLFSGQSEAELESMKVDVLDRIRKSAHAGAFDLSPDGQADTLYWKTVLEQLKVHMAKIELSELHNKMLVRQLEKLEQKKTELEAAESRADVEDAATKDEKEEKLMIPMNVDENFGNLEEELGLTDEIDVTKDNYSWQDRFRPRKPRYFHRVKSGYDWNAYNKTHYDQDNPPPKIVQGYRFNVFYPDLIDKTKTPQYHLEPADTQEYCIIRFSAGPPYEDIAFKIINREWNRSRKHGFRSTFERGVLTLYFNFATHWYRR